MRAGKRLVNLGSVAPASLAGGVQPRTLEAIGFACVKPHIVLR